MKTIFNLLAICTIFSTFSFADTLSAEELQKQGVAKVEKIIENFQQTGQYDNDISKKAYNQLSLSLELFKREQKFEQLSLSQIKIGDLYRMNNQFDLAYKYYQKALDSSLKISNKENEVRARLGKSQVEILHLKKYSEAEINIDKSLSIINELNSKELEATVLFWKSNLEIDQNNYPSAFITANKALTIAKGFDDNILLFSLYSSVANISYQRGLMCDYTSFFDECKKRFTISKDNATKALKIAKKSKWKEHILLTNSLIYLSNAQLELVEKREESQKRWDDLFNKANVFHPRRENNVLVHEKFSFVEQSYDDFFMKILLKINFELDKFKTKKTLSILNMEGIYYEVNGKKIQALKSYMKAIDLLEKQINNVNLDKRKDYLVDKMEYYYRPINLFLQIKKREQAFNIMERSRESILLTLLKNKKEKSLEEIKNYSLAMNLRSKILGLKWKNFEKKSSTKEIENLEQEYKKIVSLNFSKQLPILIHTLKNIQKELKENDSEMIEYLVQKNQLIVWHITPHNINVKSVWLPQNELVKKIDSINDTLKVANPKPDDYFDWTSSKELFLYLIQPILKDIKSKHLVIVPHYELNQLPFQLLINPKTNESLGEKFQISYAPSASIWMKLKSIKNLKDRDILAIGEPTMTDGLKEIEYITSLYPKHNKKIIQDEVTKEEFYKSIEGNNIIHLSLHGKYLATTPMLSYIQLPPKDKKEGHLTASEMFGLPLEKNSLVVLSACETGRAKSTQSNETLGIVRGLIYAGADALILSSWKVDENATALWMKTFYQVAQTKNLAESSRQALLKVKNTPKYSHPHYWAGFSLIGK